MPGTVPPTASHQQQSPYLSYFSARGTFFVHGESELRSSGYGHCKHAGSFRSSRSLGYRRRPVLSASKLSTMNERPDPVTKCDTDTSAQSAAPSTTVFDLPQLVPVCSLSISLVSKHFAYVHTCWISFLMIYSNPPASCRCMTILEEYTRRPFS